MAISLSSSNPMYYAKLFGVSPAVISAALDQGVSITSSPSALNILKEGVLIKSVALKGQAISLAKAGTLGPASQAAICQNLENILISVTNMNAPMKSLDVSSMTPGQKAAVTKVQKAMEAAAAATKPATSFGQPQAPKAPPAGTSLSSLPPLLTGVPGSSAHSTYYVVALFGAGLALAIRRTKYKLSLRAEGPALQASANDLMTMGFKVNPSYASVHLDIPSDNVGLMCKAVGAAIGAVGLSALTASATPTSVEVA